MYFDILADMLDKIEPPDTIKEKLFQNSYKWIKKLSQPNEQQRVRVVMRSAIDFLNRHINLFRDLLYPDYKYWHDIFRNLSLETTNYSICGQRALKRFYQVIGLILTNQNNEENKVILLVRYYIRYIKMLRFVNKIYKIFQFFTCD